MNGEAGKGDSPRPKSISDAEYRKKFDEAFGHKPYWFETEEHQEWIKEAEAEKKANEQQTKS